VEEGAHTRSDMQCPQENITERRCFRKAWKMRRNLKRDRLHKRKHVSLRNVEKCWVPVAHTCNPSYSGSRDQEDHGSLPDQANSLQDPILRKYPTQKRTCGVAQGVGPEFKPYCHKKKKKEKVSCQTKEMQT
jgi:hypothetical protein